MRHELLLPQHPCYLLETEGSTVVWCPCSAYGLIHDPGSTGLRGLHNLLYIFACRLRNSSFLIRMLYGGQNSAVTSSYILWWHFSDSFTIHQVVFSDMLSLLRLLFCFPREHNDFLLSPLMTKLCPSLRNLSSPSPLLHSAELWLAPMTYIILILLFNWMNWLISFYIYIS